VVSLASLELLFSKCWEGEEKKGRRKKGKKKKGEKKS